MMPASIFFFWLCQFRGRELWSNMPGGYTGFMLAKQMSEAQLLEFEEFITRNDEAGALHWLETNFPHYKDVVASEFDKLKAEIAQMAPQIISSSPVAQQSTPATNPMPPLQPQYTQPVQAGIPPAQYQVAPQQAYQQQYTSPPAPQPAAYAAPQQYGTGYNTQITSQPQQQQYGSSPSMPSAQQAGSVSEQQNDDTDQRSGYGLAA